MLKNNDERINEIIEEILSALYGRKNEPPLPFSAISSRPFSEFDISKAELVMELEEITGIEISEEDYEEITKIYLTNGEVPTQQKIWQIFKLI